MRRIFIGVLAASLLGASSEACCPASSGPPVWMTSETVIIVWDAAQGVQHFIRQANFDTKADDFGFIVPTPSVPDFGVANPRAFERLESLIPIPPNTDTAAGAVTAARKGTQSVQVLKTERVGDYEAKVVKATDGEAMNAWLKENGFVSRPAMTEWLDHYSKKSWVFTALKYVAKPGEVTNTKALRLSFKTDKPHYPYKMPADAFKPGWVRPLRLYFVSNAPIQSQYAESNSQWEGQTVWSGALPEDQREGLAREIDLKKEDIPANARVTILQNGADEEKYDEDLVFLAASSITPFLWGGVIAVAIGAWVFTQRNRRRFAPAGA